jgi:Ca2+-dependent lipid-binding protein
MKQNPTEELDRKNPTATANPEKTNKINPSANRTETLEDEDDQYEDVEEDDDNYDED